MGGTKAKRKFLDSFISGYRIMNSDDILNIKQIPSSLTIIGGGVIGCEFASVFSGFHTKVIILENSRNILSMIDNDCRKQIIKIFIKKEIIIKPNIHIISVTENIKNTNITYEEDNKIKYIVSQYCLISVGREFNSNIFSSNIAKKYLNMLITNGLFCVDKNMQTKLSGIYAIGDCINTPWLAHIASAEAMIAINSITKNTIYPINYKKIPTCIYTIPSIAWCGYSEEDLKYSKHYIKINMFPFLKNGKASLMLESQGFVKLITDKETNEILGVHILGKNSTEIISEPSLAMQIDATVNEIVSTIHAHPTLYEVIQEVASMALYR